MSLVPESKLTSLSWHILLSLLGPPCPPEGWGMHRPERSAEPLSYRHKGPGQHPESLRVLE